VLNVEVVWSLYGPEEIYGTSFDNARTPVNIMRVFWKGGGELQYENIVWPRDGSSANDITKCHTNS